MDQRVWCRWPSNCIGTNVYEPRRPTSLRRRYLWRGFQQSPQLPSTIYAESAATCRVGNPQSQPSAPINAVRLIGPGRYFSSGHRTDQGYNIDTYQTENRSSIGSGVSTRRTLRTNGASIYCFVGINVVALIGSAGLNIIAVRTNQFLLVDKFDRSQRAFWASLFENQRVELPQNQRVPYACPTSP